MIRNKGFTIIEMTVALGAMAMLASALTISTVARMNELNLVETIAKGKRIAETAELYRRAAVTATPDPNGVMTYSYTRYPAGISAQAFNALHGANVPEISAYGTPFTIFINAFQSRVSVTVPVNASPVGVTAIPIGANQTRLDIYADPRHLSRSKAVRYSQWEKRNLYNEDVQF